MRMIRLRSWLAVLVALPLPSSAAQAPLLRAGDEIHTREMSGTWSLDQAAGSDIGSIPNDCGYSFHLLPDRVGRDFGPSADARFRSNVDYGGFATAENDVEADAGSRLVTVEGAPASWQTTGANVAPEAGLVAWWRAEGSAADDANGTNGFPEDVSFAPGRVGQAFQFNGTQSSVRVPDAADLDLASNWTMAAWVYTTSLANHKGGAQGVISKVGGSGGNNGYQFGILDGTGEVFLQFNQTGQGWPGNTVRSGQVSLRTWTHIAATYDNDTMVIYVDGDLVGFKTVGPKSVVNSSSNFRIGLDDNGNVDFSGLVDEVRVYRRALSGKEIRDLCAAAENAVPAGKADGVINGTFGSHTADPDSSGTVPATPERGKGTVFSGAAPETTGREIHTRGTAGAWTGDPARGLVQGAIPNDCGYSFYLLPRTVTLQGTTRVSARVRFRSNVDYNGTGLALVDSAATDSALALVKVQLSAREDHVVIDGWNYPNEAAPFRAGLAKAVNRDIRLGEWYVLALEISGIHVRGFLDGVEVVATDFPELASLRGPLKVAPFVIEADAEFVDFGVAGAADNFPGPGLYTDSAGTAEPAVRQAVGFIWHGQTSDGWDFSATDPQAGSGGVARFQWSAAQSAGRVANSPSPVARGTLQVDAGGHHVKLTLCDGDGREVRAFDGTFAPDRQLVWGLAWDLPDSRPGDPDRVGWWATVDAAPLPALWPGSLLEVNRATVGACLAAGLTPGGARTVVGDRVVNGLYSTLDSLLAVPGLTEPDRAILRRCADVR